MEKDWSDAEYLSCFLPKEEAAPAELYANQPYVAREKHHTFENTSGQGSSAVIPPEIRGWNWGAFFFGWLWGICNSVWIALLEFVPYVGFVMSIVLGVKGNEWAWRNKRWDSIEHFKRTQKTWAYWSLAIFLIGVFIFLILLMVGLASSDIFSSQPPVYKASGLQVNLVNNEDAVDPTWQEMIAFLQKDDIDQYRYYDEVMICGDFAERLHNNAESHGIKAAFVTVWFENEEVGHALNAFDTTDLGLIYIDCTGESFETYFDFFTAPKEYEGSCDRVAFIEIGKEYGLMALELVKVPGYSDYEGYKQSVDNLEQEIKAFTNRLDNYNSQVDKFNRQTTFSQATYNELNAEARELEKKQEELEEIFYKLSPIWEPMGIVEDIEIYW